MNTQRKRRPDLVALLDGAIADILAGDDSGTGILAVQRVRAALAADQAKSREAARRCYERQRNDPQRMARKRETTRAYYERQKEFIRTYNREYAQARREALRTL